MKYVTHPIHSRRWISLVVFIFLSVTGCNNATKPPISKMELNGDIEAMTMSFELVKIIPWAEEGLQEKIIQAGVPTIQGRITPDLLLDSERGLWLVSTERIMYYPQNGQVLQFSIPEDHPGEISQAIPLRNGGVLISSGQGARQELTAFSLTEAELWRIQNSTYSQGTSEHLQFRIDIHNGSIYLYVASDKTGQVFYIHQENGHLERVAYFEGYQPENVWVQRGKLFWVSYDANTGERYWLSKDLESGQVYTVTPNPALRIALRSARAPLPGGGALLAIPGPGASEELVWMCDDGSIQARLPLAGIVCVDDLSLAVGARYDQMLNITLWKDGLKNADFEAGPFTVTPHLIGRNQNVYYVQSSKDVIAINSEEKQVLILPPIEREECIHNKNSVAIAKSIVNQDGDVLLIGTNADGAFIVKVMLSRRTEMETE